MTLTTKRMLSLLFPKKCCGCYAPVEQEQFLCKECLEKAFRIHHPYCPYCGVSLEDCHCRKKERAYAMTVAPYYYEGAVRQAILNFKFRGREDIAVFLGQEMRNTVNSQLFGIPFTHITCVPTTREKMVKRGYNQAQSLGEQLLVGCFDWISEQPEQDWHMVVKTGSGQMQHMLNASGRRKNIHNAYKVNRGRVLNGAVILLVDDIVTTGATATEISTILKLQGAKEVYVVSAALTRKD